MLLIVLLQEWNSDVSTWTPTNIQDAGTIIGGLSVSEIGMLDLSTNDVMETIGEYHVYSTAQVRTMTSLYLTTCLCRVLATVISMLSLHYEGHYKL